MPSLLAAPLPPLQAFRLELALRAADVKQNGYTPEFALKKLQAMAKRFDKVLGERRLHAIVPPLDAVPLSADQQALLKKKPAAAAAAAAAVAAAAPTPVAEEAPADDEPAQTTATAATATPAVGPPPAAIVAPAHSVVITGAPVSYEPPPGLEADRPVGQPLKLLRRPHGSGACVACE